MGIFFRAKREQLLDTEPQKKRNLCRWVRSGLIAWKNGRYERFAVSRPRLFSTAGRSTMLFRARDAFPSISSRRIVIYGTLIPPRKEQSSSPDAISPFTYTSTRHVFVSLFCCFDALCNRDEWFEIEDGFEIAVTRCWNDVYASMTTRSYALYFASNVGNVAFTPAFLVYFSLRVGEWFASTSLSQKFISVLSFPVK